MIKKILYTLFVLFLFFLYSIMEDSAAGRLKGNLTFGHKTSENKQTRASPADTSQYSIQITGPSNVVTINGKIVQSTPDTTDKKNSIRVSGEGNRVSIIQTDHSSEVTVSQKGSHNQVHISQK